MFKNIKYVLNNENGGPNLEHLMGIAITTLGIATFLAPIVKELEGPFGKSKISFIGSMDKSYG